MRKKYLSALLFGALLFASAGTFTSCKDYDDDINGLRTEITDLKSAITELQNAVQNGKYVTAVSGNGNTITFTFNDGTTTPITVETESGEPSQTVTIGEDGEVIINGEGTGYYTTTQPTEAEVEAGLTKQQNGTWWVLGEDGEYTDTKIPVSGITVSGSEAEGFTFTIVDANGGSQEVKLPSVASAITNITIAKNYYGPGWNGTTATEPTTNAATFAINGVEFDILNSSDQPKGVIKTADEWPGNKKLPNNGDYVYYSPSLFDVRIDPVDADVSSLTFYLTNTKNDDLNEVELKATAEDGKGPITIDKINGRAGNQGNGLWTLKMPNTVVAKDNVEALEDELNKDNANSEGAIPERWAYALNAAHASRSLYGIQITKAAAIELRHFRFEQGSLVSNDANGGIIAMSFDDSNSLIQDDATKYKAGTPVQVLTENPSALYDMYLEASDAAIEEYGLTFDNDKYTFTIGKNPDISTIDAHFDLIIWAIDNNGMSYKKTVRVNIDTEIGASADYSLITHAVNKKDDDNYFMIDLATMKTALGDQLNQWLLNADVDDLQFNGIATKEDGSDASTKSGFQAHVVEKAIAKIADLKNVADPAKANYIQVNVDNDQVPGLELDKTYYFKFTFTDVKDNTLNSIVVPVQFTAPALADQFVKEDAVFGTGGNTAMAYMNAADQYFDGEDQHVAAYKFWRAFESMPTNEGVTLELSEKDDLLENKYSSQDLARLGEPNNTSSVSPVTLTDETAVYLNNGTSGDTDAYMMTDGSGRQLGYGQELTVTAVDVAYGTTEDDKTKGWIYSDKNGEYTFKVKVMSPIYEGSVQGTSSVVEVEATDGIYKLTNELIKGLTYNPEVGYKVLPDALGDTNGDGEPTDAEWTRGDVMNVTAESKNPRRIAVENNGNVIGATADKEDKKKVGEEGYIELKPQNTYETSEAAISVTVTDIWNYNKSSDINVKVNSITGNE